MFFCNLWLRRRFQEWIASNWIELNQDNLRIGTAKAVARLRSFAQITCWYRYEYFKHNWPSNDHLCSRVTKRLFLHYLGKTATACGFNFSNFILIQLSSVYFCCFERTFSVYCAGLLWTSYFDATYIRINTGVAKTQKLTGQKCQRFVGEKAKL